MRRIQMVIAGGLIAGFFDITYALLLFGIRSHVPPIRIGQGIASHVLGLSSFEGGWATSALGFGLHFFIAVVMALVFYGLCHIVPWIARNALRLSPVYGLGLYAVMTYVVLPLTDPKHGPMPAFPPQPGFELASALFAHIVLVALPIAIATRRALKSA